MIDCIQCGNSLPDESSFCSKCGKKVGNNLDASDEVAASAEVLPAPRAKSNKKMFAVLLAALIVVVAAGGGWYYYDYSQKQEAIAREEKIKADALAAQKKYTDDMKAITASISRDHIKKLDSVLNDIYTLYIMIDTIDAANKTIKAITELSSDANAKIISLQDVKPPSEYAPQHNNFIDALNKYKAALEAKRGYLETYKVDIVAYSGLFKNGNIFSVEKTVKMSGEYDKLTNDIKASVDNLKQRTESLNAKF